MKKTRGILALLIAVIVLTSILDPRFLSAYNIGNIARWTGLFGILSIGEAMVIITGGIDLSVGSIVGLVGSLLAMMLASGVSVSVGLLVVLALSVLIGVAHGLLVTKMRLQPFIVTLCGLLIYRGVARYLTKDATQGFGVGHTELKYLVKGTPISFPGPAGEVIAIPMPFLLLLAIAIIAGVFLHRSVYGRHLQALGRNEQAARFSGINTGRLILLAYVVSALLAGFAGVLFALDVNAVQPAGHGNFYELYAIAAAVLGGCSLRGGEGTILGVVIGAAILRVLYNAINVLGIATQLEFAVIGAVILVGVVADEMVKRYAAARRTRRAVSQEDKT
ncbi:MAG: ribonucleotide-diphosphate reductase subunit alpha [Fimbriimonadales bacterium]